MSSRLDLRAPLGATFSLSDDDVVGFSLPPHCACVPTSSREGCRLRNVPRLLDFLGMGMGGVDDAGGNVAARLDCAFSVSGCEASSLFTLRRRLLKGQIGIILRGRRGRVFHIPLGSSGCENRLICSRLTRSEAVAQKPRANGEARGATVRSYHCRRFVMLETIWKTNNWVVAKEQTSWQSKRRSRLHASGQRRVGSNARVRLVVGKVGRNQMAATAAEYSNKATDEKMSDWRW